MNPTSRHLSHARALIWYRCVHTERSLIYMCRVRRWRCCRAKHDAMDAKFCLSCYHQRGVAWRLHVCRLEQYSGRI